MDTVLVTGAAGFAAEHLIPVLKSKGFNVIGTDRQQKPSALCDSFYQLDLNEEIGNIISEEHDIDLVIHLAAARADWGVTDEEFYLDNFYATQSLLEFVRARQIDKFLFVSSISVMPQGGTSQINEQSPNEPINAYGKSKEMCENMLIEYANENSWFCLNIVRPAVLYGPSNPLNTGIYRATDNNIFRLIDGIWNRRFAKVGNCETIKSTAYIKNFTAALLFLIPERRGYDLFIYADQPPETMATLIEQIQNNLGEKRMIPRLPYNVARSLAVVFDILGAITKINFPINSSRIETFLRDTNFSSNKLKNMGFEQPVATCDAIAETVRWYKSIVTDKPRTFFLIKKEGEK